MLLSRVSRTLRSLQNLQKNSNQIKQTVRNSHGWNYRCAPPPPSKAIQKGAELIQALAWWWMLWHLWTEPDHILGEFEYPDASKWTDEELGIPSD